MCGIAGVLNLSSNAPIEERQLRQMLAMIRHRGPDQFGIYRDLRVGLGNARLSIIDLRHGQQPMTNEDASLWIVFNGEIFNHVELRGELEALGHRFDTHCDTEVLLHLYEEYGPQCLVRLNGQFAFAIWDARRHVLFMARDRLGVRPLFYTVADGALIFGSEIKAILADRRVRAELDPVGIDQIFSFWSVLSPSTVFKRIREIPPGHYLEARGGSLQLKRYWELEFPADLYGDTGTKRTDDEYVEAFRELLIDATRIRLRADVAVGAYLSGGLDSSTIAAVVRQFTSTRLETFSISFSDRQFDESAFQLQMARALGTHHHVVHTTHEDIGRVFPEVVWHTETPVLRTAPAPMYLLSRLVRQHGYKVVLTGEGADEFLAGYDVFKEAKIRRFWARRPDSKWRPALLRRLYPDIAALSTTGTAFLQAFFRDGFTEIDAPAYSHAIRWRNTRRARRFLSRDFVASIPPDAALQSVSYPKDFQRWGPLERSQYLEATIFLSQYLLSSQGDRVSMAHSVEGRFPFLDYRLVEFCNRLPARLKLRGLTEKYILKKAAAAWLPQAVWQRPKRPYRAPIHRSFFNEGTRDYLHDLLSPGAITAAGVFDISAVNHLLEKIRRGHHLSETDDMAIAGIISTQLVHSQFIANFSRLPALGGADDIKLCVGKLPAGGVA